MHRFNSKHSRLSFSSDDYIFGMAKQDITTVCMICGAENDAPHNVGCVKNIEINKIGKQTKNIQDVVAEKVEEIVYKAIQDEVAGELWYESRQNEKRLQKLLQNLEKRLLRDIHQLVKEERERVGEELMRLAEGERTDERKAATFGDWQAETYEDKMLANAIIDSLKKHITNVTGVE